MKMETNDIDLFFKNKDKKKKSKKNNIINPATLLQQTQLYEKKKTKKNLEKSQQSQEPQSEMLRRTKEDEEWEDIAEPEFDMSNLRIGIISQIPEYNPPIPSKSEKEIKSDSDSESSSKKDDKPQDINPWGNKNIIKVSDQNEIDETENSVAVSDEVPPISTGPSKYIPPSMRSGDQSANKIKLINKRPPNITNCEEFPSLGDSVINTFGANEDDGAGAWTKVKASSNIQQSAPSNVIQPISQSIIPSVSKVESTPAVSPQVVINLQMKHSTPTPASTVQQPTKYIPPHLRKKMNAGGAHNRFEALRDTQ